MLTRGLFIGVAEQEGGDDDTVGRTARRKGGVYFWGILTRREAGEVVGGEAVRLLMGCLVVWALVLLFSPGLVERMLLLLPVAGPGLGD